MCNQCAMQANKTDSNDSRWILPRWIYPVYASGGQGHRLDISRQSMMPGGLFYQQPVTGREIVRVDPEREEALDEDLFRRVWDLSRWFGLRLSDQEIGNCL